MENGLDNALSVSYSGADNEVETMRTDTNFSESTLKLMLGKIEQELADLAVRERELQAAKKEILRGLTGAGSIDQKKRRLPKGLPRKLIEEGLKKYGKVTMSVLRHDIKIDSGYEVKDASARRILEDMLSRGLVRRNEKAEYELIEKD